jgi:tRNA (guanine37-N1)-methyltransferase
MGHADSGTDESFSEGLLEYPHYTRPEEYAGLAVPEVLLSGDHAKVAAWRRERSLEATLAARPGLLAEADLGAWDRTVLRRAWRSGEGVARLGRNLYLALVHFPVVNKDGKTTTVSLTNLDVHDMSRVSRSYGLGGFFVTTPLDDQRRLAERILGHWLEGPGARANPDRTEALRLVTVKAELAEAVRDIEASRGVAPLVVVTSARDADREAGETTPRRVREQLAERPVLLVFGTGHGLAPEVLDQAWGCLRPVRWLGDYNHLPVRSAVSILVDRVLGDIY